MADYIEREALRNAHIYLNEEGIAVIEVEDIPAADVVSKAAYDQVAWERHLAEVQLKSIGKSIGEKMDDVAPVVHGKWEDSIAKYGILIHKCSVCNKYSHMAYNYCPNCGVKMDGGKDDGMDS